MDLQYPLWQTVDYSCAILQIQILQILALYNNTVPVLMIPILLTYKGLYRGEQYIMIYEMNHYTKSLSFSWPKVFKGLWVNFSCFKVLCTQQSTQKDSDISYNACVRYIFHFQKENKMKKKPNFFNSVRYLTNLDISTGIDLISIPALLLNQYYLYLDGFTLFYIYIYKD